MGAAIQFIAGKRVPQALGLALCLGLVCYVTMRAASLSITHDEALTYAWHVRGSWFQNITFTSRGLPDNNHLLYTLLCKLSVLVFGLSDLALRGPSLLGCVLFVGGLWIVLRHIDQGWGRVVGLLAIGYNPYIVDYLGIARGYGLALGLTMVGVAALLSAVTVAPGQVRTWPARLALLMFALAACANLAFLLVLGAGMVVVGGILASDLVVHRRSWREWVDTALRIAGIVAPVLPILAYLTIPMRVIRAAGLLQEGGGTGFWTDTVGSLIEGTNYGMRPLSGVTPILEAWIAATLLVAPGALWLLWRSDRRRFMVLVVLLGMTLTIAAASFLQAVAMDVAFLQGRRAIFLLPLFTATAVCIAVSPRTVWRWPTSGATLAALVVPLGLGVHGMISMNLDHTYDWKYDADTRDMMAYVGGLVGRQVPGEAGRLRMRVPWQLEPSANYYRRLFKIDRLRPLDRSGVEGSADLYMMFDADRDLVADFNGREVARTPVSDLHLWTRPRPTAAAAASH